MSQDHYVILTINPGSTSTKIAVFDNDKLRFEHKVDHPAEELARFTNSMTEQFPMRRKAILKCLTERNVDPATLSAVSGRGGKLPPLKQGAYAVNRAMFEFLRDRPIDDHASNLGGMLAYDIARTRGIPAYIYDAVVVDQLEDIARLSGLPEMKRRASCHVLNMRAVARRVAEREGKRFEQSAFVVCHMGGGISACVLKNGRMIDVVTDEEGPYSPERSGGLPVRQLIDSAFSGEFDRLSLTRRTRGKGGLVAYLGTNNAIEVERRIDAGDAEAALIYEGMAYQTAKTIGGLATVLQGGLDGVVITGAVAYSERLTGWIRERIAFLGPVFVEPGEDELQALALGALRVLRGQEEAHQFTPSD